MKSNFLPGAVWRPVSYRAEAGLFTSPPIGWILHVVVGNGSPFETFQGAKSPNRRFSHGWVAKDGHSREQYTKLDNKAWAAVAGDSRYWHFETEGFPNEPLTTAQIHTLAIWHNFLGVADSLAEADGQQGVGTHYMGGASWGGHTCPDPSPGVGPRSHQRSQIIEMAQMFRHGGTVPTIPSPPTTHNITQTKAIQNAVHVSADGVFGVGTLKGANAVIAKNLTDVKYLQARVGANQDGQWGPISEVDRIATIKSLQNIIGVTADSNWGPISQAKWASVVRANYV